MPRKPKIAFSSTKTVKIPQKNLKYGGREKKNYRAKNNLAAYFYIFLKFFV